MLRGSLEIVLSDFAVIGTLSVDPVTGEIAFTRVAPEDIFNFEEIKNATY